MRIDISNILGRWNKTEEAKDKTKAPTNYTKFPAKGEVIKGQITDIQHNKVTVRLDDGQTVEARMTDNFEFVIGDKLSFVVKESNQELLLIKPLIEGNGSEAKIIDILKSSGLPETEKNIEIVTKLIDKNMPINKKTLTDMSMFTKRFPEAKVDHLIFLMKNDILISKDSLHYVSELLKNKTNMSRNISTFNIGVANIVDKASGALVVETILSDNEPAINVFTKIKNFFLKPEDKINVSSEKLEFPITKLMTGEEAKALIKEASTLIRPQVKADGISLEQQAKPESVSLEQQAKSNGVTLEQNTKVMVPSTMESFMSEKGKAFSDLFSTVENLDIPEDIKDATNKLLAQRVTKSMLNNELMMNKEDLQDVERINKHYNKVYNKIIDVLNLDIQDTSDSVAKVLKEAAAIKTNVEMMNQLQQNHQFVHLPIVLNNQDLNSELYIMNNRNSKTSSEERVTALLRLDLRNLGHLDIYVAKTANNVEVTFYVDKDDTQEDIRDNTLQLTNKLINESFNVLGIGVMMKDKEFDIFEDFIDNADNEESKRFTFDMRA